MMSLAKASVWTAFSTLSKIIAGILIMKLLAVSFGLEGVGLAGNFRQLITMLCTVAGAGIFNGVTIYVAKFQHQPQQLRAVIGTASAIVLGFSTLMALVLFLAASPISSMLFGHVSYQNVVRFVAFLQIGIAWANLILALLKGLHDARGNALALITGSLIGVLSYILCWWIGGYAGALVGLAMIPALFMLPALLILRHYHKGLPLSWLKPVWHPELARILAKFTMMALITSVTMPVTWIMIRNLLAEQQGWEQVGLWQGITSISDAYLQFITATFSVWLLPTLSQLEQKPQISREITRAIGFVLPAVAVASFCVWLLRDMAICLLFSPQFTAMRDMFIWQLCGDFFKVGAYVFGYLVISKASLRFYILTEVSQCTLLTVFSHWLILLHGTTGAVQGYMVTYLFYFVLCCGVFMIYCRTK